MSLIPLLLLLAASEHEKKNGAAARGGGSGPKWPSTSHHPPHSMQAPGMPAAPAAPPEPTPADHARSEERHSEPKKTHAESTTTHHDDATHLHDLHNAPPEPAPAGQHVEQHAQPAPRSWGTPRSYRDIVPGITLPKQHPAAPAPRPTTRTDREAVSVASAQKLLVKLGWRGDLTTKGPVIPELEDGEYGPITHRDWAQSANKRGLDPTFERIGPNTVRVNPATFAALQRVAGGGVSGIYIP